VTAQALPAVSENGAAARPIRPFYWSVRRELWENRSLYIAPLIVAAVQVIGLAISTIGLAERRRALLFLGDAFKQRHGIEEPYDIVAIMMVFTIFLVKI